MGPFWRAMAGGFVGKILGALFIAICLALGFGPTEWASFMIAELPTWVTPTAARMAFLSLAAITAFAFAWPVVRARWPSQRSTLRKYYTVAEAAAVLGIDEETIYQAAITGQMVLSVVDHVPQNFEEVSEEIREGKRVATTTRHEVVFSARSDPVPSLELWYISPDDVKNVIRNPDRAFTLVSYLYKTRECLPASGKGFTSPRKFRKADLLVSAEEIKLKRA
jgi:hypothetical protein